MGKFALLIGVSEYAEGLPALPAATQDIVALQRILADPQLGNFDEVRLLPNPTRDEMSSTVELWIGARQADDLALLFFSGHGLKDDYRELYFATGSTRKVDNQLIRSTALSARTLHDFLRRARPRKQVVILDCCFGGAFGDLIARDDGEIALKEQLAAEGRVVMTSTSSVDYAFEDKKSELSVYTRYLVEGIEKGTANLNGDDFITVDELHKFASRKVKETTQAMSPKIIMLEGQGHDIVLSHAPQDKPELSYRKEVEKQVVSGIIPRLSRRILKLTQANCQLSDSVVAAIEAEVLKPFIDYQNKLDDYRDALKECVEDELTFDRGLIGRIKEYQKRLGLKNKDVRPIETGVVGRVLNLEDITPLPVDVPIDLPVDVPIETAGSAASSYPTFSFETVRVNDQGKVIETIPGKAEYFTEDLGNNVTLEMVRVPGGKFLMGAAKDEEGASKDEYPQHEVTVPEFWMGKVAVTQEQWAAVAALKKVERDLALDPAKFKGAKRPVEQVSWEDAVEFCKRLSQRSERLYNLPSEAQWEYACRAGTTTPFHFGPTMTTDLANYRGTDFTYSGTTYPGNYGKGPKGICREKTTDVESFNPNAFGLYDMHGNVWEWCLDGWHDSYKDAPKDGNMWESSDELKVLRGGSWGNNPTYCRAADRRRDMRDYRSLNLGFRVLSVAPRT